MQTIPSCVSHPPAEQLLLRHRSSADVPVYRHYGVPPNLEPVQWGRKKISVKQVMRKNQRKPVEQKNQLNWSQTTILEPTSPTSPTSARSYSPINQSCHPVGVNSIQGTQASEFETARETARKPSINTVSSYNWQGQGSHSFDTVAYTAQNCSAKSQGPQPSTQQANFKDSPQPSMRRSMTKTSPKPPSSQYDSKSSSHQNIFQPEPMFGGPPHPVNEHQIGLVSFGKKQQKIFLSQLVTYFDAQSKRDSLKSKSRSKKSLGVENNNPEQVNVSDQILEELCEDESRFFGFNSTHNLSSLVRHVQAEDESLPSSSEHSQVIDNHKSMMNRIYCKRAHGMNSRFDQSFF